MCSAPQHPWPGGNRDFAAVLAQHPHGGFIQACEADVGDAAGEEGHAIALGAPSAGKCAADLAEEERDLGGRRELRNVSQPAQHLEQPRPRTTAFRPLAS